MASSMPAQAISGSIIQNRPVHGWLLEFTSPGAPLTDVIARLVAQSLSDSLGQQFYVEYLSRTERTG